jgi:hypothetical protein
MNLAALGGASSGLPGQPWPARRHEPAEVVVELVVGEDLEPQMTTRFSVR